MKKGRGSERGGVPTIKWHVRPMSLQIKTAGALMRVTVVMDYGRVRIALAKNAGCLQNGSHMLLLTWNYLVSCLFCKKRQEERVACVIHFVRTQHF